MPYIMYIYIMYIYIYYVCVLYSISYIGVFFIILYNSLRIYQEYDMANTGGLASNLWSLSSSLFSDLNVIIATSIIPCNGICMDL